MSFVRPIVGLLVALAVVAMLPKVRLHPATPGITTSVWSGEIHYTVSNFVVSDGSSESGDLYCTWFRHDSSPYWEGSYRSRRNTGFFNHSREIEQLCELLPRWLLTEGFPPRILKPGIEAPLFFGRIV